MNYSQQHRTRIIYSSLPLPTTKLQLIMSLSIKTRFKISSFLFNKLIRLEISLPNQIYLRLVTLYILPISSPLPHIIIKTYSSSSSTQNFSPNNTIITCLKTQIPCLWFRITCNLPLQIHNNKLGACIQPLNQTQVSAKGSNNWPVYSNLEVGKKCDCVWTKRKLP